MKSFRNSSNLSNDKDYVDSIDQQNQKWSQHQLDNVRPQSNYLKSLEEPGLYHSQSNTVRENSIDIDSNIRNGERGNILTSNKSKTEKQLKSRFSASMPFTGPGSASTQTETEDTMR